MSLIKKTIVDEITVCENGAILVREATKIIENDKEISKIYHRTSLVPGQEISNQPQNVIAVCNAVWTPEVIAAYKASLQSGV
jgi:hypothetical protein